MSKYCTKCGAPLVEEAKFCVRCGNPVDVETKASTEPTLVPSTGQPVSIQEATSQEGFTVDKVMQWLRKNYKLAGIVLAVCVFLFLLVPSSDVSTVKNGSFAFNQSAKVGPAFEKFFADTSWDSKEVNGKHFVYFKGKCENVRDGSEQLCKISFEVYPKSKTFRVVKVQMDGNDVTAVSNQMLRGIVAGNKTIHYGF